MTIMRFLTAAIVLLLSSVAAQAQNFVIPCVPIANGGCTPVTSAAPLPVTGSGGTFPITGTTSNANSTVAPTATNIPAVAYLWGFNGSTYQPLLITATQNLQMDITTTSNNLHSDLTAPSPCKAGTLPSTQTATTDGLTIGAGCDLNGNGYAKIAAVASGATGGVPTRIITCDNYVFKHITSATDTLAVQGVTGQSVYICGYEAQAAGTATFYLENTASVNANCSSTLTQISILSPNVANSGIVSRSPFWSGLKNTVSNGLCINSTGTGGVDVGIYYAQF